MRKINSGFCVFLLVSNLTVKLDDEIIFLTSEVSMLDAGFQVINPPEPAALAASVQSWKHINSLDK